MKSGPYHPGVLPIFATSVMLVLSSVGLLIWNGMTGWEDKTMLNIAILFLAAAFLQAGFGVCLFWHTRRKNTVDIAERKSERKK